MIAYIKKYYHCYLISGVSCFEFDFFLVFGLSFMLFESAKLITNMRSQWGKEYGKPCGKLLKDLSPYIEKF